MGKFFKLFALVLGTFTLASGVTSCKNEECCSWTDDFEDEYTYCEDSLPTQYTWAQIQAASSYYGGTCD